MPASPSCRSAPTSRTARCVRCCTTPSPPVAPTTEELETALRRCGLAHLVHRLDEEDRWDKLLSGGEQQRIGFVRLLVQKPDIVILDEATAALDVDTQASIMNLFRNELGRATLISVGHRPELAEFHNRRLSLRRTATEVSMETDRLHRRRLSQLLRRTLRPRPGPDGSRPPANPRRSEPPRALRQSSRLRRVALSVERCALPSSRRCFEP